MNIPQEREQLAQHLEDLGTGRKRPEFAEHGICSELRYMNYPNFLRLEVEALMAEWPEYSGHPRFPVKGWFFETPRDAYLKRGNLWKGFYGRRRKRLCLFLAKKLKETS